MNITDILAEIKQSKKYKTLSEEIINEEIQKYLKRNPHYERYKDKKILKDIKTELHKIYGSFQTSSKGKREKYLEELKLAPENLELTRRILLTNSSTKERLEDYEEIYQKIFAITGKPNSILDLGCGLNPISFPFMNLEKVNYYAYDIDNADISLLNDYFYTMKDKISGKAEIINLSAINEEEIKKLPKADVCFMFKLVDVLDRKDHKQSEKIITNLKSDYIVVSFSKKTITGKMMNFPYRGWIERMLERNKLDFQKIDFENEVFYIVKKS
jgi:16S rRNA (guanine(1405)-N(7))-methyltransferase